MDGISHCTKNGRWKLESRSAIGVLLILLAVSLLGWVYLTQASFVATTSRRVDKLEVQKARLEEENLELMTEIARLESVSRLCARAQELGFEPIAAEAAEYLALAEMPSPQSVVMGADPTQTHWWDNVASQFTAWAQESP
jgi:hypothetical protein